MSALGIEAEGLSVPYYRVIVDEGLENMKSTDAEKSEFASYLDQPWKGSTNSTCNNSSFFD
jgi:hypothetical protein